MIKLLIFILGATYLLPCASSAATIRVNPDGTGDAVTIVDGVGQARENDTVLVAPAAYIESTIYIGYPIHLISQSNPESTIISHSVDSGEVIFVSFIDDSGEGG